MKNSLLFICAFILCSCAAEIERSIPILVMQSPEVGGEWPSIEAGGGVVDSSFVRATPDAASIAPDTTTPRITRDRVKPIVMGSIGVAPKWVDLWADSTQRIGAKVQFLGRNAAEAEGGNFSGSVLLGVGSKNKEGSATGGLFATTTTATYEMQSYDWRVGSLLGYRFSPSALFYAGAFYGELKYSGNFTSNGRAGRFAGYVKSTTWNSGLEFLIKKIVGLRAEYAYSVEKIPSVSGRSSAHSGGLVLFTRLDLVGKN